MNNVEQQEQIILYTTADGKTDIKLYSRDGRIWLNQSQLAELFDTSVPNISMHVSNVLQENELDNFSVIKNYLTTAQDGKNYSVTYYSLEMILAIGFRVKSKRGTQFRIWANTHLNEYLVKGFIIDDERLKNPDNRPDYFDELLERIRDIRSSEKRFYQKVRDLFALSTDYDPDDKAVQMFFAEAQNKLLYGVTNKTAAELVASRADAKKLNMALTSWKGSVVRKQDIYIAKNYLTEDELDSLNRLVVIFLETAEFRIKQRKTFTVSFWQENFDQILKSNAVPLLATKGTKTHEQMEKIVEQVYTQFDAQRKTLAAERADTEDLQQLAELENHIKTRKKRLQ